MGIDCYWKFKQLPPPQPENSILYDYHDPDTNELTVAFRGKGYDGYIVEACGERFSFRNNDHYDAHDLKFIADQVEKLDSVDMFVKPVLVRFAAMLRYYVAHGATLGVSK